MSVPHSPLGRRRQLWLMDRQEEAVARVASKRGLPRAAMAAACGMPLSALATSTLLTSVLPHDKARDVERRFDLPTGTLHPLHRMPSEEEAGFEADSRLRYLLDPITGRDESRVDVGALVDQLSKLSDQGLARAQCARAVGVDYQRFAKFETSRTRTAPKWLADRVAAALGHPDHGRNPDADETDGRTSAVPTTTPGPIVFHVVDDARVRVVVAARTSRLGAGRLAALLGQEVARPHARAGEWIVMHDAVVPVRVADAVRRLVAPEGTKGAMVDARRRRERRRWFDLRR